MLNPTDFPEPTIIPVNGVELEVFEAGRENEGKPIVLCHGWPEHAFSWRHLMPTLAAAGYHVIAPNQRGYGNSSRPTEVTDTEFVPHVEVVGLDCGHWIQEELPEETNQVISRWLEQQDATVRS
jgi:pimeloyl-ACP methyl ester carboxylesterase